MFGQNNNIKVMEFDGDIREYSQGLLAQWAMDRKKIYGDINVVIRTSNGNIQFDTLGCNSEADIVKKHQDLFNQIGLPKFFARSARDNDGKVKSYVTLDTGKTFIFNFENCDSLADFRVLNQEVINQVPADFIDSIMTYANNKISDSKVSTSVNDNQSNFIYLEENDNSMQQILMQMIHEKKEHNQEVIYRHGNMNFSTESCTNVEDIYVKYQNEIFDTYEHERNQLLNTPFAQQQILKFQNKEVDVPLSSEEISIVQSEYNQFLTKNVDFSSPVKVVQWLDESKKYINDININPFIDVNSFIEVLRRNGYTSDKNDIHNIQSFYTRIISYELEELEKYHFFATSYVDNLNVKQENTELAISNNDKTVDSDHSLLLLEKKKKRLLNEISYMEQFSLGNFDINGQKTPSFASRKKALQDKMNHLEMQKEKYESMNIATDLTTANNILNSVVYKPGRFLTDDTSKAIQLYSFATGIPTKDNIMKALEKTQSISIGDEDIKNALLTSIIYLHKHYSVNKDADELKEISDYIDQLNFKTDQQKLESCVTQLNNLTNEYHEIETKEEETVNKVATQLKKKKEMLVQVENEINATKTQLDNTRKELFPSEEKRIEDHQAQNLTGNIEIPEPTFAERLEQASKEGRIFTDESRIAEKDKWMNVQNAQNMGHLNENDLTKDTTKMYFDGHDITPKDDTLKVPHPIKAIKKAGTKIREKISSFDFKQKMKNALNWFYKHKVATFILGVSILAGAMSIGKNTNESYVSPVNDHRIENSYDKDDSFNIPPASLINQEAIDDAIQNLNTGDIMPDVDMDATTPENSFDDVLNTLPDNIIDGSTNVYTQENHAFDDVNSVSTNNLYIPSWQNAEVGAFYQNDNGNITQITKEEAEQKYNNGEEIVAKMENDGVGIGFVNIGKENQENTGMSK